MEQIIDYKQYKWLISSCLQKSIRRGRYDLAQNYVKFLWKHDRSYLTYRFGTILTEDVSIANLPLIKEYLDTKLVKKTIDEKGGVDFFLKLTQQACESLKDRSSCDSAYVAQYYSSHIIKSPAEIFFDNKESYINRINSSWIVLGNKKFKNSLLNLDIKEEGLKDYLFLISNMHGVEFSDFVEKVHNTQIENIFLGIPVMQSCLKYESLHNIHPKLKVGETIENMYVKEEIVFHKGSGLELISSGIDGHTREGKGVYYKFLKTKNSFVDYLNSQNIPQEEHILLFSHCIFRIEGHEVNKRLYYPTAVEVMRDCESKILEFKAGKPLDFSILRKTILENMIDINKMRHTQIEIAPIPMIYKK